MAHAPSVGQSPAGRSLNISWPESIRRPDVEDLESFCRPDLVDSVGDPARDSAGQETGLAPGSGSGPLARPPHRVGPAILPATRPGRERG